jgi:hypothetical protein
MNLGATTKTRLPDVKVLIRCKDSCGGAKSHVKRVKSVVCTRIVVNYTTKVFLGKGSNQRMP